MKYNAILSDFDGTILRSDGTVSERTINAIKAYKAKGGKIALCTGRIFNSIRPEAEKIGLGGEIYCYNGAAVYDTKTGVRRTHTPVSMKYVQEICKYFEERDLYFQTYLDDVIFCQKFSEAGDYYYKNFSRGARFATGIPLSSYFEKHPEARPTKFLAILKPEEMQEHIDAINEKLGHVVMAMRSNAEYLEIVNIRSGKGNALLNFCKQNGIPVEECVAFGDSLNDVPMLKNAGVGVVVENAREDIKASADYVCASNDQDGVAEVIEMIIGGSFELMK